MLSQVMSPHAVLPLVMSDNAIKERKVILIKIQCHTGRYSSFRISMVGSVWFTSEYCQDIGKSNLFLTRCYGYLLSQRKSYIDYACSGKIAFLKWASVDLAFPFEKESQFLQLLVADNTSLSYWSSHSFFQNQINTIQLIQGLCIVVCM